MKRTLLLSQLAAFAIGALLTTSTAIACGESLYRVGKGVTYREYTAPLPGTILIVAKDEQERLLADALLKAGHDVEVVADASGVGERLAEGGYDIVLSRFEHSDVVDAELAQAPGAVDYLPVARHDTNEVREARARYRRSLSDDDNLKIFLIQIHRALKTRKA